MHIAYCTNVRLPSERAHGHQIAQVCDALAKLGHTVTIFAPVRANTITENYHQYYKAEKGVSIEYVKGFDAPHFAKRFFSLGFLGLLISNATLRKNISVALKSRNFDAIYTRTPALMSSLLKTSVPIILELHQLPRWSRRIFVRHCNQCRTVVCLTSIMKETLRSWGIDEKKLTVEPDGVDLARFASMHITTAARAHFNLTTSRTVVGYVGRLKTLGMEKASLIYSVHFLL